MRLVADFPRVPTVLYICTCLHGQRFYAPNYRDTEYVGRLRAVARVLNEAPDIAPIMKVHTRGDNALNPIKAWCRREAPRVEVIDHAVRTDDLWKRADVVALDLPTTPLLEALARDLPVLVWTDPQVFPVTPESRVLLEEAVLYEPDWHAFLDHLRRGRPWVWQMLRGLTTARQRTRNAGIAAWEQCLAEQPA